MDSPEIAEAIVDEFADEYDIDLSGIDEFPDKCDHVREFVEQHDTLEPHTEVEIELTVNITTGISVDTMLWGEWYDQKADDITISISDHGFRRSADVQSVAIEEIWDF